MQIFNTGFALGLLIVTVTAKLSLLSFKSLFNGQRSLTAPTVQEIQKAPKKWIKGVSLSHIPQMLYIIEVLNMS